jgi:hypothetical protein
VEETIHDKTKQVPRNPSSQGLQPMQSGFPIPITTLVAPLLQLQEQVAVQSEVLKEFISGMQVNSFLKMNSDMYQIGSRAGHR